MKRAVGQHTGMMGDYFELEDTLNCVQFKGNEIKIFILFSGKAFIAFNFVQNMYE